MPVCHADERVFGRHPRKAIEVRLQVLMRQGWEVVEKIVRELSPNDLSQEMLAISRSTRISVQVVPNLSGGNLAEMDMGRQTRHRAQGREISSFPVII